MAFGVGDLQILEEFTIVVCIVPLILLVIIMGGSTICPSRNRSVWRMANSSSFWLPQGIYHCNKYEGQVFRVHMVLFVGGAPQMVCKGKILLSTLMASVMCMHFSMQEEHILEHINAKCYLCTLQSTCRPLCNMGIHLVTLPNIIIT